MTDQTKARVFAAIGFGVPCILLIVVLSIFNHQHRKYTDALREAEAAKLALHGQIVSEQESKADLKRDLKDMVDQNELLREAYEMALKAAPGAQPDTTAHLDTGPMPVQAVPAGSWMTPLALAPATQAPEQAPPAPGPSCILAAGDKVSVVTDQISLITQEQNTIIAGTAEVWREDPPPRVRFAAGKFRAIASDVNSLPPPVPPRWGAEVAVLCLSAGCGVGGGVLLPPLSFLGLRWEGRADLYAGPALAAGAALGVRW